MQLARGGGYTAPIPVQDNALQYCVERTQCWHEIWCTMQYAYLDRVNVRQIRQSLSQLWWRGIIGDASRRVPVETKTKAPSDHVPVLFNRQEYVIPCLCLTRREERCRTNIAVAVAIPALSLRGGGARGSLPKPSKLAATCNKKNQRNTQQSVKCVRSVMNLNSPSFAWDRKQQKGKEKP